MHIVWFKRDLRVYDHRPLVEAARRGPVLPLYVVEPDLWRQADMSGRHWAFVVESLRELRNELAGLGQPLVVRVGEVIDVLAEWQQIDGLWSHAETGNDWTYKRDLAVGDWCRSRCLPWHEHRQDGVIRCLNSRQGWARRWDRLMGEPLVGKPQLTPLAHISPGPIPSAQELGLVSDLCADRQTGGGLAGRRLLASFLEHRGETYRKAMSSPVTASTACSRLSPHLAYGTIAMREVAQATWQRQTDLKLSPRGSWRGSMRSFNGRLHWHCHFMQKLEDEPALEFENLHKAYDGLRPKPGDQVLLNSWSRGETGWPFVDACMRSLAATGWLNFRMRAMLMAVASYQLWLDWRAPGEHLARLFTDYEPGIHWPQVQMQSGTTGMNTVRIYNPIKQGKDQDPQGKFVRQWLPELRDVPDDFLHEPWLWEGAGRLLDKVYPSPVVDHLAAARFARTEVWGVRRGQAFKDKAKSLQHKHGSRRSGISNRGQRAAASTQLSLL